jgi:aspartate aminotransferase
MRVSKRISSVGESATIAITALARRMQAEGRDVVSFGAGEPDFDTPAFIKDAAKAALDAGDTKYTPRAGAKLLEAIAAKLQRENGLRYEPNQVLVTFGGKHALYSAFQCLLDEGDEVLVPAPYWVSYVEMVKLAGGRPVILRAARENGFKIDPAQIASAAGAKTRAIILNSPSNPTGAAYSPEELATIARAVLATNMVVFSDEIYEKLIYGDTKFVSFAALDPALPARTVTFNGLAKTFSMPGWRLGWAAGPKDFISAMRAHMSHSTSNPVSFAQAGALAAYTDPRAPAAIEAMRKEFEVRGRHMADRLSAMPGVSCVAPAGAFYCFPDVSAHYGRSFGKTPVKDSTTFAQAALHEAQVAIVPGVEFGEDRCVRLSFATGMRQIDQGLDRLEKLLRT